jgi:hypothetical protein
VEAGKSSIPAKFILFVRLLIYYTLPAARSRTWLEEIPEEMSYTVELRRPWNPWSVTYRQDGSYFGQMVCRHAFGALQETNTPFEVPKPSKDGGVPARLGSFRGPTGDIHCTIDIRIQRRNLFSNPSQYSSWNKIPPRCPFSPN